MARARWQLPVWAAVLSVALGVLTGYLIAVMDSVFLFSGTGSRFVIVMCIASIVASIVAYAWMVELKTAGDRRQQARERMERMSDRQLLAFAVGLLALGALWVADRIWL